MQKGVDFMKLQISLNDELLARVDRYADDNYLSRSGLISQALVQFLNQYEYIAAVTDLSVSVRKLADTGKADADTLEKIQDFERIVSVLNNNRG